MWEHNKTNQRTGDRKRSTGAQYMHHTDWLGKILRLCQIYQRAVWVTGTLIAFQLKSVWFPGEELTVTISSEAKVTLFPICMVVLWHFCNHDVRWNEISFTDTNLPSVSSVPTTDLLLMLNINTLFNCCYSLPWQNGLCHLTLLLSQSSTVACLCS